MKMEIKLLRDGTSCLYENGEPIINLCFDKIERLSDKIEGSNGESNYYLLWQNDKCFYLYHTKKHIFVPTSSGVRTAKSFRVIENYSEETGSFAAYRSDNDLAYLIYEDGVASSDLFISIGAESEDEQRSRPVKYSCNGDRWCFFESKSKKMAWNKSFGYQFNDGLALYKRYQNNFFSVLNPNDKSLTLAYYDNNAEKFVSDTFEVGFRDVQDRFISLLEKNSLILDFGCGSGRDTKAFLTSASQMIVQKSMGHVCC